MLSHDQISSALIFFAVSYSVISFLFRDSTVGKRQKRSNLVYALAIIGLFSAFKLFYDGSKLSDNYYKILQVSRHSNTLDIRRSYKQLSKEYHPDKNLNNDKANVLFQDIKVAYDVLMDETTREVYNRFGNLSSFSFDPRRDELKLITEMIVTYLTWIVLVYVMTLPTSSRSCRTWITVLGIGLLVLESTFLLTETTLPTDWSFLPQSLTEFEVLYWLHALFPVVVAGLRILSEYLYVDVDQTTHQVLSYISNQQKELDGVFQKLQQLVDISAHSVARDSKDTIENNTTGDASNGVEDGPSPDAEVEIAAVLVQIAEGRNRLEALNDHTGRCIAVLKNASSAPGSSYYWLIFVVMYGAAYIFG